MKKIISILLIFTMLTIPTAFADEGTSSDLQSVLIAVKSKIAVSEELSEFESNVSSYGGKTNYNFDWHTPDYEKSLSITADEKGNITNYSNHSEKVSEKKLSGISKSEITAYADSFIAKALPDVYKNLVLDADSYSANGSSRYSFTYKKYVNDVTVKDNFVNITVCISEDDRLYVRNMSANIDYKTPFSENTGELDGYLQKYKEAFPLELVYQSEYNHDWKEKGEPMENPVLIYRVKDNFAGFISAETGEVVSEDKTDETFRSESMNDSASGGSLKQENGLTEKELAEITEVEGLLSVSQIESKIKSIPYIKFPANVALENSSLYKNNRGEYVYNLFYSNNEKGQYNYVSLSANAKDGKLLNYNCTNSPDNNITLSESQKQSTKEKTEKFLLYVAEEEFKSTQLGTERENGSLVNKYYQRMVNGIKHLNNGISVTFDAKASVITYFSLTFTDGVFEAPEKAVDKDIAYNNLLSYSPVTKMYVRVEGAYKVCYTLEKSGVIIDALTGKIKNQYNETPAEFSYTDIKGHWAEEAAEKLSEIQVGFSGDKLVPDKAITQEEYLRLLATGIYGKYYHNYKEEELYDSLIREKIITEEEKNPTSQITREESFVYIIRMANLERVAKIENIYKVEYIDKTEISPDKIGYCAILSGFNIIGGSNGKIRPKNNLTRGEAIVMLYRYLLNI